MEWDDKRYVEFSLEIDPKTRIGSLYVLSKTEEEIVDRIHMPDNWGLIEKLLSSH